MSTDGEIPPPPPPGVPPPISNPDDNEGATILGAVVSITSLALIIVLTRGYVRGFMIRNLGWDDYIMAFTMAVSCAGMGLAIAQVQHGAGQHRGDVPEDTYITGMKLNFISQPTYLFAICFVKLSVGYSLLRIASTKIYRYLIISIMGFMLFYTTGCFFTIVFQCTDIRVLWNQKYKSVCWSQQTLQSLSYTNVALNILTDLLFAIIIPAPMLWKLNVNTRTRFSLLGVLGLGVFACAAAFIKVGYLVNYGKVGDFLWDSRNITIWTVMELNIGIIAGSLPTLRPLFKRFLGSVYGRGTRKTNPSAGAYAHGTNKSGNQWQTLSSGRRLKDDILDDGSSQEAINIGGIRGRDEYELKDKSQVNTTIVAGQRSPRSDDDINGIERTQDYAGYGIQKTMVTTVDYSTSR